MPLLISLHRATAMRKSLLWSCAELKRKGCDVAKGISPCCSVSLSSTVQCSSYTQLSSVIAPLLPGGGLVLFYFPAICFFELFEKSTSCGRCQCLDLLSDRVQGWGGASFLTEISRDSRKREHCMNKPQCNVLYERRRGLFFIVILI